LLAGVIFCRVKKIDFWHFADTVVVGIPLGYTLGRVGNFINGELYGRVTTLPWGMYFPLDPTHQLRHPSQLYEAFFEGILLFAVLWRFRKIKLFDGFIFCLYIVGYGMARFFVEFVREPDVQIGLTLGYFTRGQVLCACMILCGVFVMLTRVRGLCRISIGK
jgi:phosphatidylglycerol:prolipoprotein diacylglycerol transferase